MTLIWLTGLSGAGKTTLASSLEESLNCSVIDGDVVRKTISKDLQQGPQDREKNLERVIILAKKYLELEPYVVAGFVSPKRSLRDRVRKEMEMSNIQFIEVFVKASLSTCENRDVKGLYKRYRNGEDIKLAGLTEGYEEPLNPEVICDTEDFTVPQNVLQILSYVNNHHLETSL